MFCHCGWDVCLCSRVDDWLVGLFPPLFETHVCACFWEPVNVLGGQPVALYVGALIDCLVG